MIYNSSQIQAIIPHRYPMLLVDQIIEMSETKIIGLKAVSAIEALFTGHFPQKHVFPGVFMIEACAQTGAVLLLSQEANKGKLVYLAGINKTRFKRQVIPGETMRLEVELVSQRLTIGVAAIKIHVEDELVLSGEIMFGVGS